MFSEVDRPHRLVFHHSMTSSEWDGRTVESEMTVTFEDQGGKTLLTMVQTGFETEELRDDFLHGWPAYLDTLGTVVGSARPGACLRNPARAMCSKRGTRPKRPILPR